MEAFRKVYESLPKTVRTPDSLKGLPVEVILLPLDRPASPKRKVRPRQNPIEQFIGAWHGEPLVRPDQGQYEVRKTLK